MSDRIARAFFIFLCLIASGSMIEVVVRKCSMFSPYPLWERIWFDVVCALIPLFIALTIWMTRKL